MHTITVTFGDGSGWIFTKKTGSSLWEQQDVSSVGAFGLPGVVANDTRMRLIEDALQLAPNVIITSVRGG